MKSNHSTIIVLFIAMALTCFTACKKELLVPGAIEVSGEINTDSVWQHRENATVDYIVSGSLQIGGKLTIHPGTIIQLKEGASVFVSAGGILSAIGTANEKITITAVAGAHWGSLVFYSESDSNRLNYCYISRGGKGSLTTPDAMVVVGQNSYAEGKVSIRDCVLEASVANALYINDRSQVTNFSNNAFNNNTGFPVTLTTENVTDINITATFSANGRNYVEIRDCVTPAGESQTISKLAVDYYIQQQVTFRGYDTIKPGVAIKFGANGALVIGDLAGINSSLTVQGSLAEPVRLQGEQGISWKGVFISGSGPNNLQNAIIRDAGSAPNAYGQQAGVVIESQSSSVSIRDCVFDNSGGYGIDLGGNTNYNNDIATGNVFTNCALGSINY